MARIIAITGGSGAGKSTLARALAGRLGGRVLAEDDYYLCVSTLSNFDPASHNFDTPAAKDHALLCAHLARARAGAAFDKPCYDLTTHRRGALGECVPACPALVVEGLHLLTSPALRALFDFSVFVDAPETLRLERRVLRDQAERHRDPGEVRAQFFANVKPMHEAHVEPQRAFADLVVVAGVSLAETEADAERIAEALK